MTRTTNARIAGFTFLAYIAAGLTSMAVFARATRGEDMAEKLATIAQHATDVGVLVLLGLAQSFAAIVLAVTLHAITREEDPDLASAGLACRLGEGLLGSLAVPSLLALRWLATDNRVGGPEAGAAHVLGAYLLRGDVAFGPILSLLWLPMLAFEVPLAFWLLFKGVAAPAGIRLA
jgi:hypothetical protein